MNTFTKNLLGFTGFLLLCTLIVHEIILITRDAERLAFERVENANYLREQAIESKEEDETRLNDDHGNYGSHPPITTLVQ